MVYADGATPRRLPTWWCYVVLSQCALGRLLKSFGQGNTLFLSTPGLRSDTGLSRSALSSLFTVACFAAAALQPYFGKLQDRFGGRISIPAALLGLSVALLLLSSAQGPVCCWFVERRSEALSCLSLVYFSLTQLVLVQALSAVVGPWGWRAALRCAAATCAAAAPLTAALLRSTPEGVGLLPDARGRVGEPAPPPPSHLVDAEACDAAKPPHPTDAQPGAKAVGVDACERDDIPLLVAEESHFVDDADASDCSHTHAPPPAAPPELPPAFTRQEALATPLFRSWAFYTFVYFVVVSGSDFFLGSIVAEAGTVNVATTVSLAGGVASGVGCVAVGVALSRKAATPNAALALSGLLISLYALLLPHCGTDAVARLAGVARGFADASAGVALPALHAAAFGRPHSGAIFSVNRMLGVVGSGVGPLFFGLSRDAFGSFSFPLLAVAPLPAVAAAVAVAMMRRADAAGLRRDGGKGGLEIRRESGGGQHGVRSEELLAVTGSGDGMRALA